MAVDPAAAKPENQSLEPSLLLRARAHLFPEVSPMLAYLVLLLAVLSRVLPHAFHAVSWNFTAVGGSLLFFWIADEGNCVGYS